MKIKLLGMRIFNRSLFYCFLVIFYPLAIFAQDVNISGKVIGEISKTDKKFSVFLTIARQNENSSVKPFLNTYLKKDNSYSFNFKLTDKGNLYQLICFFKGIPIGTDVFQLNSVKKEVNIILPDVTKKLNNIEIKDYKIIISSKNKKVGFREDITFLNNGKDWVDSSGTEKSSFFSISPENLNQLVGLPNLKTKINKSSIRYSLLLIPGENRLSYSYYFPADDKNFKLNLSLLPEAKLLRVITEDIDIELSSEQMETKIEKISEKEYLIKNSDLANRAVINFELKELSFSDSLFKYLLACLLGLLLVLLVLYKIKLIKI